MEAEANSVAALQNR